MTRCVSVTVLLLGLLLVVDGCRTATADAGASCLSIPGHAPGVVQDGLAALRHRAARYPLDRSRAHHAEGPLPPEDGRRPCDPGPGHAFRHADHWPCIRSSRAESFVSARATAPSPWPTSPSRKPKTPSASTSAIHQRPDRHRQPGRDCRQAADRRPAHGRSRRHRHAGHLRQRAGRGHDLPQAKYCIEQYLSQFLDEPEISLEVWAYNSKVYYVVTQGAGMGDAVYPLPGHRQRDRAWTPSRKSTA